ncbi:hypothetical protein [Pelagimonas sp. KU-00592-HH]|uniref:hypothetical protein n=1 Tax=Pelagimonas sp. KU-00592-HH TaxID=3127651 RepID=UPI0033401D71
MDWTLKKFFTFYNKNFSNQPALGLTGIGIKHRTEALDTSGSALRKANTLWGKL